jgi:16S rRNA processing protein RimM
MTGELVPLGYVVSTHGIKGQLKVKTFSGEGASLLPDSFIHIRKTSGEVVILKLAISDPFKNYFLISFEGIKSMNDALPLVKGEILIKQESLPHTVGNEYYWNDLLNCGVYSVSGESLGTVLEIIETGGADVIVIRNGKHELLLPLTENVIKKVNIAEKKLIVDHSAFIDED